MPRSNAWKALEREAARELGGVRISRGADFSESDVDVNVKDYPFLKVDAKYRIRHSHHKFMSIIQENYCKSPGDVPVLVTKSHNQQGSFATVPTWFLGLLLQAFRDLNQDKDLPDGLMKTKVLAALGLNEEISTEQAQLARPRRPRRTTSPTSSEE
jgi:hypothetical protein